VAGAIVSGTVDSVLPDLPDAQLSRLSNPGDLGDLVLDLLAGDVISLSVQLPLHCTQYDNTGNSLPYQSQVRGFLRRYAAHKFIF